MFSFTKDVSHIGGWLTRNEGKFLYENAKSLAKNNVIIEIGSWKGRSTICLAMGVRDGNGAIIYAIDPHKGSSEHHRLFGKVDTYREFIRNIKAAEVEKFIKPVVKTSEATSRGFKEQVNFVFVDGAHEYRYVRKDYDVWFPKIVNGGTIAFHDSWHSPGVQLLTTMILFSSGKVRKPRLLDTLTIMEKVEKNSLTDRIYNILFVFYRLLVGWIGTVKINFFGGTVLN